MRYVILLAVASLLCACSATSSVVYVPANQSLEVDLPNYPMYEATLKNTSLTGLGVGVLNKCNDEFIRGFGLGTKGKVEVMVDQEAKLVFKNESNKGIKIRMRHREVDPSVMERPDGMISFTLANNSAKSIPLLIPSVMNPNLSPFSKSGVDLKIGQEILFRENGKRHVLLVVNNEIDEGEVIDVGKLLKERRVELGL
ncbi:MAG: hypothetical protein AAFV07_03960 [Bacteroidota bacterium]